MTLYTGRMVIIFINKNLIKRILKKISNKLKNGCQLPSWPPRSGVSECTPVPCPLSRLHCLCSSDRLSSFLTASLHCCSPSLPYSLPSANILSCLPFVVLQSLYKLCFPLMSPELLLNMVLFHWFIFFHFLPYEVLFLFSI